MCVIVPHVKRSRINLNSKRCCEILFQTDTSNKSHVQHLDTPEPMSVLVTKYRIMTNARDVTIFNTKYKMLRFYAGQV